MIEVEVMVEKSNESNNEIEGNVKAVKRKKE
jgi:hypothetical protein